MHKFLNQSFGRLLVLLLLHGPLLQFIHGAALPASESLLPASTWAFVTSPNTQATKQALTRGVAELWHDPAMQPFRDHAEKIIMERYLGPWEKRIGFNLKELVGLVEGQTTLALVPAPGEELRINPVILVDSGSQSEALGKLFEQLRQQLSNEGTKMVMTPMEEETLYSLDLGFAAPFTGEASDSGNLQLHLMQAESIFLATTSKALLADLIRNIHQGTFDKNPLGSLPAYQSLATEHLNPMLIKGWVNWTPLFDSIANQLTRSTPAPDPSNPMAALIPTPSSILKALKLEVIKGFAFGAFSNQAHTGLDMMIQTSNPNGGLLDLVKIKPADSAPPTFVSGDVASFQRIRLDLRQAWTTLEGMLESISPQASEMLRLSMTFLGKDRDPNFDFRSEFINNLGDDIITVQWPPKSTSMEDLLSQPDLYLVGSPNPEALTKAFIAASGLIASDAGAFKERSFLGRKIYSITLPSGQTDIKTGEGMGLHFAAAGRYVAFSSHFEMIETYLRGKRSPDLPLAESAHFKEASQAVGGLKNGYLAYQNQETLIRLFYQQARQDPASLFKNWGATAESEAFTEALLEVFDFTKLPAYEAIEPYMTFTLTGNVSQEGVLKLRTINPLPSALKATN
jgi:hypothetical protein